MAPQGLQDCKPSTLNFHLLPLLVVCRFPLTKSNVGSAWRECWNWPYLDCCAHPDNSCPVGLSPAVYANRLLVSTMPYHAIPLRQTPQIGQAGSCIVAARRIVLQAKHHARVPFCHTTLFTIHNPKKNIKHITIKQVLLLLQINTMLCGALASPGVRYSRVQQNTSSRPNISISLALCAETCPLSNSQLLDK